MTEEIKNKIRDEMISLFNEYYSGMEYPRIDHRKIDYFVEKALNRFETELFNNKKLK